MNKQLLAILRNPFAALWIIVFAAIAIVAPERGPTAGILGRLFMAFWCASGLTLASLHLFKLSTARIVLDAVFTIQGRFMLFGTERDVYAMSDFAVRAVGIGLLLITSLGIYDIFFR
jgi:hypothetical protein